MALFRLRPSVGLVEVNRRWLDITGLEPGEFEGDKWWEVVHEDDRSLVGEMLRQGAQRGGEFEFRIRKARGGGVRLLAGRIVPLAPGPGAEQGDWVGVAADVTERRRQEHALRFLSGEGLDLTMGRILPQLCDELCRLAGADFVVVGLLQPGEPVQIQTLHLACDGRPLPNTAYPLRGAPCELTLQRGGYVVEKEVAEAFPDDAMLRDLGMQSYAAVPLCNHASQPFGLLGVLARRPLAPGEDLPSLLQLFATRITAEILRERVEKRFAALFESAPDALLIMDADWRVLSANAEAARVFGRSVGAWGGVGAADLFEGGGELLGSLLEGGGRRGRTLARRQGGGLFTADVAASIIESGEDLRYAVVVRDLTEALRAEEQIHDLAELLDHARDAIITRDMDLRVTYWNAGAQRIFGWTREEACGRTMQDLFGTSMPLKAPAFLDHLRSTGAWTGELRLLTKTGGEVLVESRSSLVLGGGGGERGVVTIMNDITERKRIEEQLLRTQRLESLGTLASGVAHDLNNILGPILVSTGLLRLGLEEAARENILETIECSAQRGAEITRQLLTFTKGVQGGRTPLRVPGLLQKMEKIMRGTFPKNIVINLRVDEGLPPVLGNATQFHQVLLNLCVNARDAMPDGGTLILSAAQTVLGPEEASAIPGASPGSHVLLEVQDTGMGIPADIMDRIFDPFFTTKGPEKGSGLGLATVLGIVRSHQGFLAVESRPGQGTAFRVYLPPAQETEQAAATTEEMWQEAGGLVLVVEDDAAVREAVGRMLEATGLTVVTAVDGVDGMVKFSDRRSDLAAVITDLVMPNMEGLALVRAIRRLAPEMPVVAMTGVDVENRTAPLRRLGVRQVLAKPFTAPQLLQALREALQARK